MSLFNPEGAASPAGAMVMPQSQPSPQTTPMTGQGGVVVVSQDTVIKGEIRDCQRMEVYGYFEGAVQTGQLIVHPEGRFFGTLKASDADIHGTLQGEVFVRNLINVGEQGSVNGNIQYGRISIQPGGDLSAELRNIPPEIAGDMQVTVSKGKSVIVTTLDLTAVDPDDDPADLTYSVTDRKGGHIAMAGSPATEAKEFKQTDLEANKVLFVHDGQNTSGASFSVVVRDKAGASSGKPQTVNVAVRT